MSSQIHQNLINKKPGNKKEPKADKKSVHLTEQQIQLKSKLEELFQRRPVLLIEEILSYLREQEVRIHSLYNLKL